MHLLALLIADYLVIWQMTRAVSHNVLCITLQPGIMCCCSAFRLLPQGMIVFERDFLRGHIFPLYSQKMQIRTSSLINASIFYLNDFFLPGKNDMCSTHAQPCADIGSFFLFCINEGEDIREGKAFVSNCVVMILFSKQMIYKGRCKILTCDGKWIKGSKFFFLDDSKHWR